MRANLMIRASIGMILCGLFFGIGTAQAQVSQGSIVPPSPLQAESRPVVITPTRLSVPLPMQLAIGVALGVAGVILIRSRNKRG